jgi:acetylornithine deacetylase/succinyl-diaminopimelate desuccinylase-like protein
VEYYAALIAKWDTLTGTTAEKLAAINALVVAGPTLDVPVSALVGYLGLNLKLAKLQAYAANPPSGSGPEAVAVAQEVISLIASPNAPGFGTSDPAILATVTALLEALVADANTGLTSADQAAILALAATSVPWWQASVADGGAGLSSPVTQADLDAAGGLT